MAFLRRAVVRVDTFDVSDLRVKFRVDRTLRKTPSHAEIEVFNLSENTIGQITSLDRPKIVLLAGYRDRPPHNIFIGSLKRTEVTRADPDIVLKISSDDGPPKVSVNTSFQPGTSISTALDEVVSSASLDVGNTKKKFKQLLNSRNVGSSPAVVSGSIEVALDALLAGTGVEWSVQDGQLQLFDDTSPVQSRAVVLDSNVLVGSPTRAEAKRIKGRALIVPGIAPGLLVNLDTILIKGFYRIESASYIGDTRGQEWYIDWEAKFVG